MAKKGIRNAKPAGGKTKFIAIGVGIAIAIAAGVGIALSMGGATQNPHPETNS